MQSVFLELIVSLSFCFPLPSCLSVLLGFFLRLPSTQSSLFHRHSCFVSLFFLFFFSFFYFFSFFLFSFFTFLFLCWAFLYSSSPGQTLSRRIVVSLTNKADVVQNKTTMTRKYKVFFKWEKEIAINASNVNMGNGCQTLEWLPLNYWRNPLNVKIIVRQTTAEAFKQVYRNGKMIMENNCQKEKGLQK